MTDENQSQELSDDQIRDIAENPPKPDEYPEGQDEELAENLPDNPNIIDKAAVEGLEKSKKAGTSAPVKTFDAVISAVEEGIESAGGAPHTPEETLAHVAHGDTTVFMGKTYNIPIYSSVYLALGAFTILEVAIAEIISSDVKIPLLLGFAIAKSLLVVMFYMHLKQDSRIFALALAVPLGIALLSMLFLLAVPATGY